MAPQTNAPPRSSPAFVHALPSALATRPAPFSSAFLCTRPVPLPSLRPSSPARVSASLPSLPSTPSSEHPSAPRWHSVRRLVHLSAMSVALFTTGLFNPPRPAARLLRPPTAIAATPTPTVKDTSPTGDAEAAAMTLGAVTIGGLVMRTIVSSRRDEDAEKKRLEDECSRLEQQEKERALRAKRKKMEMVDGASPVKDDELLSDLMKRVQSLENPDADDADNDATAMRHTPIPDRGTGSAVLDRPEDDDETEPAEPEALQPEPELANPEELEMLNRMWNLSSGDADTPNKPPSSS